MTGSKKHLPMLKVINDLGGDPYLTDGLSELFMLLYGLEEDPVHKFPARPPAIAFCADQGQFNEVVLFMKRIIEDVHIRLIPAREENIAATRGFIALMQEAAAQVSASPYFGKMTVGVGGAEISGKIVENWRGRVQEMNADLRRLDAVPLGPDARIKIEELHDGESPDRQHG